MSRSELDTASWHWPLPNLRTCPRNLKTTTYHNANIIPYTQFFPLCVARYDEDWDFGSVKLPRSSRVDANIYVFAKHYP
jgi:hypothetical protein